MKITGYFLYNLVIALWIGGISIFTFIITPVIFRSFGRDTAGEIVGKLFPVYFLYNLILSVLAGLIIIIFALDRNTFAYKASLFLIVAAVVINLFLCFKLHPEIREVKREIKSFESTTEESPLRKKFRKLHGISATLNLLLLADGITLLMISSKLKR